MALDFKSIVVGPLRSVLISIRTALDTVTHIWETSLDTANLLRQAYEELRDFDLDPHWKIRAISAPQALDQIKTLGQVPARLFIAVRDLVQRVKAATATFKSPVAEATAAVEEAGALEGGFLRIFPRLAALLGRAATRLLAAVGLVVQLTIDVANAVNDIHTIAGQLHEAIQGLNRLDAVFLQQRNKRRIVELADGTTMKIRIGHLHK
jgi:hypothetical protein